MNNDLISREALKKAIMELPNDNPSYYYTGYFLDREKVLDEIDNAPTVEYPFYQEAYQTGYEEGKEDVIQSIAKQYSEHNELVPKWLSIGDLKGGGE